MCAPNEIAPRDRQKVRSAEGRTRRNVACRTRNMAEAPALLEKSMEQEPVPPRFSRRWKYPTARKESLQLANSVGNCRRSRNRRPRHYVGPSLVFWNCRVRPESFGERISGARRTLFVDCFADLAYRSAATNLLDIIAEISIAPGCLSPPQTVIESSVNYFAFNIRLSMARSLIGSTGLCSKWKPLACASCSGAGLVSPLTRKAGMD
jgi:hypothetical protein